MFDKIWRILVFVCAGVWLLEWGARNLFTTADALNLPVVLGGQLLLLRAIVDIFVFVPVAKWETDDIPTVFLLTVFAALLALAAANLVFLSPIQPILGLQSPNSQSYDAAIGALAIGLIFAGFAGRYRVNMRVARR